MAASSQRVVNALQEMRQTCSEQTVSNVPAVSRTATETGELYIGYDLESELTASQIYSKRPSSRLPHI